MSLFETPATTNPVSPDKARHVFSWIESIAIPVALSVMEAQPIALGVILVTSMFSAGTATPPVGAGVIAVLVLGLLWWAMVVEYLARRAGRTRRTIWLHSVSWGVALAALFAARHVLLGLCSSLMENAVLSWPPGTLSAYVAGNGQEDSTVIFAVFLLPASTQELHMVYGYRRLAPYGPFEEYVTLQVAHEDEIMLSEKQVYSSLLGSR